MIFKKISTATLLATTLLGSHIPCAYGMQNQTDDEVNASKIIIAARSEPSDEEENRRLAAALAAQKEELARQKEELARQEEDLRQQRAALEKERLAAEETAKYQADALAKARLEAEEAAQREEATQRQAAAFIAAVAEAREERINSELSKICYRPDYTSMSHREQEHYNAKHYARKVRDRYIAQAAYNNIDSMLIPRAAFPGRYHPCNTAADNHLRDILLGYPTDHPCKEKLEDCIRAYMQ